ncbi:4902_t:CDS:2, partial [Dentiscutata erythropus]
PNVGPDKQSKNLEMIEEMIEEIIIEEMITEKMTIEEMNVEDLVFIAVIALIEVLHETEEILEKILEKEANIQTLIITIVEELVFALPHLIIEILTTLVMTVLYLQPSQFFLITTISAYLYEEAKKTDLLPTSHTTPVKCNIRLRNRPYQAIIDS